MGDVNSRQNALSATEELPQVGDADFHTADDWFKQSRRAEARHETYIHSVLMGWSETAHVGSLGLRELTRDQQNQLRSMVIGMFVDIAMIEAKYHLDVCARPEEFELYLNRIIETISDRAPRRWKQITARYQFEGQQALDSQTDIAKCFFATFTPTAEGLISEAWKRTEVSLGSEYDGTQLSNITETHSSIADGALLGKNIELLRVNEGLSVDQLTEKSDVSRNTLLRITRKGKKGHPNTMKQIADALNVSVTDLSDPRLQYRLPRRVPRTDG